MLIFLLLSYLKTFHKKSEIENLLQGCPFSPLSVFPSTIVDINYFVMLVG